ncbi:hypothetical protein AMTR_s00184p00047940, partial [Amborella trichopoda]
GPEDLVDGHEQISGAHQGESTEQSHTPGCTCAGGTCRLRTASSRTMTPLSVRPCFLGIPGTATAKEIRERLGDSGNRDCKRNEKCEREDI